jgi:integrase
VANLTALEFGRTLFLARQDGAKSLIEIPAAEMKAGEPHKAELPAHLTAMLRVYKDEMLEPMLRRKATHLFDTGQGKLKQQKTISWLIKRTVDRHLGITMTSQQFRHLTSKLTLDANPGALHLVTANLGHKNSKTTLNFYAGLDTRRAGRFLADLVEQERAKAKQNPRTPRGLSSRKKRP